MSPLPPHPLLSKASPSLSGALRVPGDKSVSHRALILGAMAVGETKIEGLLEGEDVIATADALKALGAGIVRDKDGIWHVHGLGVGGFRSPEEALDFGNSGTGVRLMMGALTSQPIEATLTGDASLCKRPMGRVLTPLAQMGANFQGSGDDKLPLTLIGARDALPIVYELPVASAQVKSAILLAGLNAAGCTSVIERAATRDHTERMLNAFGARIETRITEAGAREITVTGYAELQAQLVRVPADPSSAAFPMVAALITPGSDIVLSDVMLNETRGGLIVSLREMGAEIDIVNRRQSGGEDVADLKVCSSALKGIEVPAERAPSMIDEYPVLAVAAACASGETRMRGLGELRIKESDRLAAIADGLGVCGVAHEIEGDDLIVRGGSVAGGGPVKTHMDHRIAMAFLVLGLASNKGVIVDDGAMIATSFPAFEAMMRGLGCTIESAHEAVT